MVEKYDQLRPRTRSPPRRAPASRTRKLRSTTHQNRLRDKLTEAMEKGTGLFRGVSRDASSLGKSLSEILKKLFGQVVPDLYPKLEMGSRPLKGDEAEVVLKAADLKGLPKVFYDGEKGLGLVKKDGPKSVINPTAPIVKEVFDYLKSEQSYGNKEPAWARRWRSGSAGSATAGSGTCCGWSWPCCSGPARSRSRTREPLPQLPRPVGRTPFTNNPAFRNSLFSPRQSLGLKTLTQAVQQLEDITGEEVDVEEGAIATAFKKVAAGETGEALSAEGPRRGPPACRPVLLNEYQQTLVGIQASASDDCVRILTETGASVQAEPGEGPALAGGAERQGDRPRAIRPGRRPASSLAAACPPKPVARGLPSASRNSRGCSARSSLGLARRHQDAHRQGLTTLSRPSISTSSIDAQRRTRRRSRRSRTAPSGSRRQGQFRDAPRPLLSPLRRGVGLEDDRSPVEAGVRLEAAASPRWSRTWRRSRL